MTLRAGLLAFLCIVLRAQTGALLGVVADPFEHPVAGAPVTVRGPVTARAVTRANGEFSLALPYGEYRVESGGADFAVTVSPLHAACVKIGPGGGAAVACPGNARPWSGASAPDEPAVVTEPLDFSWPVATVFPLLSERAYSWTSVRYTLQGVDTTDPYQPGRTDAALDPGGIEEVGVLTGFDLGDSRAYGSEVAAFVTAPGAAWHGAASTSDTGGALASNNLPALRGTVQQTAKFHRDTNDSVRGGGPLGRRVEAFGSLDGEWSSQTVPLEAPGTDLQRTLLRGGGLVRVHASERDLLQFDVAGSRAQQPDWGMPAGIEAWAGRPMAPAFTVPSIEGFAGCAENDAFESFQAAWNRSAAGALWRARYAASSAHLDTRSTAPPGAQSSIDLATGATNGVAPLTNLATRTRQAAEAEYARPYLRIGKSRHALTAGVEWDRAGIRNRFAAPSGMNTITADGAPAYVVVFNTPQDSRESITNFSARARDAVALAPWATLDVGAVANVARGGPIAWNTLSPRVGLALAPAGLRRLTLRAGYERLYAPIAGRYLDFGDPNSLAGQQYFMGTLVNRFGGPYSSIDPALRPPRADEFNLGAQVSLPWKTFAQARFFRREERDRIAAVDTGVPASDYVPVAMEDDNQPLTVYAQQPASFGQDRYLLTNPAGLSATAQGMVMEAGGAWRGYGARASFMAVETSGPVNPGNSPLENDPGVIGALDSNPNAGIDASGRQFFDRAYVGKAQFTGALPRWLGGIQWDNTVNYMDGAAFARQLLVTGLPQGPILVDATVHGSPGGGSRAEHVMNWNARFSRALPMSHGEARVALDVVNATNAAHKILEESVSGPTFNERLPLAIEAGRFVRMSVQYAF